MPPSVPAGRRPRNEAIPVAEDVRASRSHLSPFAVAAFARRLASVVVLGIVDVSGLVLGLYAALTLRALLVDPKPILWGFLWTNETDWLPFLILLMILVFWQKGLYGRREVRESAGRVVPAVILVAALVLAFAIGTGQHFTTFGLYVAGTTFVGLAIGVLRASYEAVTGTILAAAGVKRRAVLVGDAAQREHLRATLGARRGGIDYDIVDEVEASGAVEAVLGSRPLDELLIADAGMAEERLLQIVETAHRRQVKVLVAARATELLYERGRYVPGQGIPLFELRAPVFAGADWVVKRTFDVVVATLIVVALLPVWLLIAVVIKLTSRGHVFYADERVGLGEQSFRMIKFRTMVEGAEERKEQLERDNEATGALFKIRHDPRVTPVGRALRRFSIDEIPNLLNVLRGEMTLVGPRPLPVRDFERLEPWHRRRYHVLPGMTGLWQVAGRSDLTFDDLVRLDFYYLENWSIWLDLSILLRTPLAVVSRKGAY